MAGRRQSWLAGYPDPRVGAPRQPTGGTPRDRRYTWAHVFGAICPVRGVGAGLVMPSVSLELMSEHLFESGRHVAPGAHCLMQVDGVGWHRPSERLIVPANITLLTLPPYSPELNPVENVWRYLCSNWLSHRMWESYEEIVDACCVAWNALMAMPERITSIATRDWAQVSL